MIVSERLTGKVAAVLTAFELVINRGTEHGVKKGHKFAVLNRNAVDVVDPETGESLGSVDVAKVLVQAVRVQDRLAVCRTFETQRVGGIASFDLFGPAREERVSFETASNPAAAELDPEESLIAVGDFVVAVTDKDEFTTHS